MELNSIMGMVLQSRQELERTQHEREALQARLSTLADTVHMGTELMERLEEVSNMRQAQATGNSKHRHRHRHRHVRAHHRDTWNT